MIHEFMYLLVRTCIDIIYMVLYIGYYIYGIIYMVLYIGYYIYGIIYRVLYIGYYI